MCLVDSDAADDVLDAEITGSGRVALQIPLLGELLDALTAVATDGHRLVLTRVFPNAALKVIGKLLADRSVERVTLQRLMPCTWPARAAEAAE